MLGEAFRGVGITGRVINRGEIYLVRDELITIPEERIPTSRKRTKHPQRPVLILQTDLDNTDPLYPLVLIAPLSHRVDLRDERDYLLKAGQGGLDEDSIVQLGLIQPILKTDLESNPIGRLDTIAINDIDTVVAGNLGLIHRPTSSGTPGD